MTTRVLITRIDDLALASNPVAEIPAEVTVTFAIGPVQYELDLSAGNYEKFTRDLEPYTSVARRTGSSRRRRPTADRQRSADIRGWAKTRGREIADRGRIPGDILSDYLADTGAAV